MADTPEYISRAEIARRSGVGRGAVTNWVKRHRRFPRPTRPAGADGGEQFAAAAVADWLDGRRIPSNALLPGEQEGATYGRRFRASGPASADRPEPADQPEPPRREGAAEVLDRMLKRQLLALRGSLEVGELVELTLSLFYLRTAHQAHWSALMATTRAPSHGAGTSRELLALVEDLEVTDQADGVARGLRESQLLARVEQRQLIDLLGLVDRFEGLGRPAAAVEIDVPGVARYLLALLATLEDRRNGTYYTPRSLVQTMVALLAPQPGERIYDPCCGSGEALAAAGAKAAAGTPAAAGSLAALFDIDPTPPALLTGEAFNDRDHRLARLNLALHGMTADIRTTPGTEVDARLSDGARHDVILTNPPFNTPYRDANRSYRTVWPHGEPPDGSTNFAWLQVVAGRLAPGGRAAVLMTNNAALSNNFAEQRIRNSLVRAGLVECLVALPSHLFHSTAIPVTVWVLRQRPAAEARQDVLFIDATRAGTMVSRTHRILGDDDIERIAHHYRTWQQHHAWQDEPVGSTISAGTGWFVGLSASAGLSLNPLIYTDPPDLPVDRDQARRDISALTKELQTMKRNAAAIDARAAADLKEAMAWIG